MPITHSDGQTYFSQAEVENTVKDRVKAKDTEIAAHTAKIRELEPKATLAAQLEQQLAEEKGRFGRYQQAAAHGVTDTETLWALEQAHSRAMAAAPEAARADFGAWLGAVKADPNLAPPYLRPLFTTSATSSTTSSGTSGAAAGQGAQNGQQGTSAAPGTASAGASSTGAGNGQNGQQGAVGAQGRPAWAAANAGQQHVATGTGPSFADRVRQATSLEDLAKLSAERRRG
ncbi:MAG TPA: hypothetical protein VEA41_20110 [Salinarimonas sp.]|nr:hypothetical protein [Salinarimonas sp.]